MIILISVKLLKISLLIAAILVFVSIFAAFSTFSGADSSAEPDTIIVADAKTTHHLNLYVAK